MYLETGYKLKVPVMITSELQYAAARFHGKAIVQLIANDYHSFVLDCIVTEVANIINLKPEDFG